MRNIILISLLAVCCFYSAEVKSQDFHLSQFDANAMYFNPALAGKFNGEFRVHGHYRTQWSAIATKPFTTAAIAFDMPLKNKKFAVGAMVMNNRAGAGLYNVLSVMLNGAYDFTVDENKFHHISAGLQAGIIQKSINEEKLYFASQYTPFGGGTFDQAIPSGENLGGASFIIHGVNAGLLYYYSNEQSRINPFVGFTTYHLTEPKETFYNTSNKIPMRHVLQVGTKVNITERIQAIPKILNMYQTNAKELLYSIIGHYYLKNSDTYLIFGPTFRSKDAAVIEAGIRVGAYTGRISYDINTSSLKPYTDSRGGFEISLTYIPRKINPNPISNCPRL